MGFFTSSARCNYSPAGKRPWVGKGYPIVETARLHFQGTLQAQDEHLERYGGQCAARNSDAQLLLGAQHGASGSPAGEIPWIEEGYSMAGNHGKYRAALVKHISLVILHPCSSDRERYQPLYSCHSELWVELPVHKLALDISVASRWPQRAGRPELG